MLWLCCHLPQLPLEVFDQQQAQPLAVFARRGQRDTLLAVNAAAAALGIHPGMTVGSAQSLAPPGNPLQLLARHLQLEHQRLQTLADWALGFSDYVAAPARDDTSPTAELLLEAGGSLTLFGGAPALLQMVCDGLQSLGHHCRAAMAPTPAAARLLARHAAGTIVMQRQALRGLLGGQPLHHLPLPARALTTLQNAGVTTLADLLRLPRAGLARRCGAETLAWLDRLLGRAEEPLPRHRTTGALHCALALPAASSETQALRFALQRLLKTLRQLLLASDSAAPAVTLSLRHEGRAGGSTRITLHLVQATRNVAHLLALLSEKLDHTRLPAPVAGLELLVANPLVHDHRGEDLFGAAQAAWPQLLEQLRGRLGDDAVRCIQALPDPRPEKSWQWAPPPARLPTTATGEGAHSGPARPLWLLDPPRALAGDPTGANTAQGGCAPLALEIAANGTVPAGHALLRGPERIEGGWWDGADVTRDYYQARDARGRLVWLFRDRRSGEWFMQGLFG